MLILRAADDANRVIKSEVITLRSRDPPPSFRWWSRSRQSQTFCGLFGLDNLRLAYLRLERSF